MSAAHRLTAAAAVLLLGGCAAFSDDGGARGVGDALNSRGITQPAPWIKSEADAGRAADALRRLLAQPLTADAAVEIALLNNRGLQATWAELGIARPTWCRPDGCATPAFPLAASTAPTSSNTSAPSSSTCWA